MIQPLSFLLLISIMGVMQASEADKSSQISKIKTYKDAIDFAQNVSLEDTVESMRYLASTIPTSEINPDYSHFKKIVNNFYKHPQVVENDIFFTQACENQYTHQWLIQKVGALPTNQIEETYDNLLKIRSAFALIRPPKGCVNAVTHGISLLQPYVASRGIKKDDCHSPFQMMLKKVCCYPIAKKLS